MIQALYDDENIRCGNCNRKIGQVIQRGTVPVDPADATVISHQCRRCGERNAIRVG